MNADVWALIGTAVVTLVLVLVPGLLYTWYALEDMIDDKKSYEGVIAKSNDGRPQRGVGRAKRS